MTTPGHKERALPFRKRHLYSVPNANDRYALSKAWAAFARPGAYEVRCSYELDLEVPHEPRSWAFAHERWSESAEETIGSRSRPDGAMMQAWHRAPRGSVTPP